MIILLKISLIFNSLLVLTLCILARYIALLRLSEKNKQPVTRSKGGQLSSMGQYATGGVPEQNRPLLTSLKAYLKLGKTPTKHEDDSQVKNLHVTRAEAIDYKTNGDAKRELMLSAMSEKEKWMYYHPGSVYPDDLEIKPNRGKVLQDAIRGNSNSN